MLNADLSTAAYSCLVDPSCQALFPSHFFSFFFLSFLPLPTLTHLVRRPPHPTAVLYKSVLKPLNKLLTSSDPVCQADVLRCYTQLAKGYAERDWNAYYLQDPAEVRHHAC
jgi:hypothetical protein